VSEAGEGPLTEDELAAFAQRLLGSGGDRHLLVAVSGGVDSMALMHLAAEAVRKTGRGRVMAATVDHGLRPESADEARFVAEQAQRIGLAHRTLVWHGAKPSTGIQAAARAARYHLLAQVCHSELCGRRTLLTAHTMDDQAETLVMRLARGSGVEGLSGIREFESFQFDIDERDQSPVLSGTRRITPPVAVARPFLGLPKSRLIATMRARGLAWIEDPSNENAAFERVRIRRAMPVLQELGLTSEALARSARRLRSVRVALDQLTLQALNDQSLVRIDPLGFADIDRAFWADQDRTLPIAIQLRALAALIRAVGGAGPHISLQSLEVVMGELGRDWALPQPPSCATTLGRAKIMRSVKGVRIVREAGRGLPPPVQVTPSLAMIWDGRFDVRVGEDAPAGLELRALGPAGRAILKSENACPPGVLADVIDTLPAFWQGDKLVAVPVLADAWHQINPAFSRGMADRLGRFARTTFRDGRDQYDGLPDLE